MNRLHLGIAIVAAGVSTAIYLATNSVVPVIIFVMVVALTAAGLWIAKNWQADEDTPEEGGTSVAKMGNMLRRSGFAWAATILGLGTFFMVIFPYLLIRPFFPTTAVVVAQITAAIWVFWLAVEGIRIIPKPMFWVVERFGQLWIVKQAGIRFFLLLGLVDKVREKNTFAFQRFKLYEGDKEAEIDFADGASAPVRGDCWFKIVDAVLWTYAYTEGESYERVQQIVDGFIRPKMQALTISQARTEQTQDGKNLGQLLAEDDGVKEALAEIGVELDVNKPFILSDIVISKEIQDALKEKLVAEILADADRLRASGVKDAIEDILRGARDMRGGISYAQAVKIFTDRTALQTLEKMAEKGKVDFNFVAPDIGGVVKTFGVGGITQGDNT
tara:strand:- start:1549 stop:2709 length:1161 start_codon:yes stop_codon:yes gene_type:complete